MVRLLIRHFFGRFFDTEALSPQGDPLSVATHSEITMPQACLLKQARLRADRLIQAKGGRLPLSS